MSEKPPPKMKKTITLSQACRFERKNAPQIAFVGAGGKTTALFHAARELAPCIVTTTTHLGAWQAKEADQHLIFHKKDFTKNHTYLFGYAQKRVTLVTGKQKKDKLTSLTNNELARLAEFCKSHSLPLLIEADGAHGKPLKAPKAHEPAIPNFVNTVVVVAGLSGIGKELNEENIYNAERFNALQAARGKGQEKTVTAEMLGHVLIHNAGGLKRIPADVRKIVLLNQADTPQLQATGKEIAESLLLRFDSVVVASLQSSTFNLRPCEPFAAIILAAGGSSRYGKSKQLLNYHGEAFVRRVAKTARNAGLDPVIIVTGADKDKVAQSIRNLPVEIAYNPRWRAGQSESVKSGIRALEQHQRKRGGAIFLLADQPQVTEAVLNALVEEHAQTMKPVIAPLVEGQRANPVLWDCITFQELLKLEGDVGGRALFSKFPPHYRQWNDSGLLLDVDTPEAYKKLLER